MDNITLLFTFFMTGLILGGLKGWALGEKHALEKKRKKKRNR